MIAFHLLYCYIWIKDLTTFWEFPCKVSSAVFTRTNPTTLCGGCFFSQNHRIPWVGMDPQGPSSPTPGSTQDHPDPRPHVWERRPNASWTRAAWGQAQSQQQSVLGPNLSWLRTFLYPHLPQLHIDRPGSCHCHQRAKLSAAPLLPMTSCRTPRCPPSLSHSSNVFYFRPFTILVASLWMLSRSFMSFFILWCHTCIWCWRWGCTVQSRAGQSLLSPAAALGLMPPRARCCSDPSCRWPESSDHLHTEPGLSHPRCRIKFRVVGDCSDLNLSRSLAMVSLPLWESTTPSTLEISADLFNIPSIPTSESLIKTLKRSIPKTEPCRTPAVTDWQLRCSPTDLNALSQTHQPAHQGIFPSTASQSHSNFMFPISNRYLNPY